MKIAIERCPFCGCEAFVEGQFGREWWVQCENDHTDGRVYTNLADAVNEWNKRAP